MREEKGITKDFILHLLKQKKWRIVISFLLFIIDLVVLKFKNHCFPLLTAFWFGFNAMSETSKITFIINWFLLIILLWCVNGITVYTHIFLILFAMINSRRDFFYTENNLLHLISGLACFMFLYFYLLSSGR